jgi:hypothetical protein
MGRRIPRSPESETISSARARWEMASRCHCPFSQRQVRFSDATLKVFTYDPSGEGVGTEIYSQAINAATPSSKVAYEFVFNYVPTGTDDALRFEYVMNASTEGSANIGFAGISFTPVPEPGVVSCAAVAALSCGFLRRRRMA